jgi:signal transduction histidine kinase
MEMMDRLINDLLEVSRIGRVNEPCQNVDTYLMVKEVVDNFHDRLDSKHIDVRIGYMPTVTCEKNYMTRVFANLIDNSIKYMKDGPSPAIDIGCEDAGETWRFHVRDNGIGIPEKYLSKIFKMFVRIPGQSSKTVAGSGIGLSIVKRAVEAHGGEVWLDSKEDAGTTFFFTIPKTGFNAIGEGAEAVSR